MRRDLVPGHRERALEHPDDAVGDAADVLGVADVVQQHGELVAAQARGEVAGLERAEQASGDRLQQLVADRVPERVVDRLEVVEIQEEDRVVAPARGQQLAEPIEEERAVGQAGQRVVEGLVLEAALELAQLGDEVLEAVVLQRDARVVGQRAEEGEVVAVEAAHRAAVGDEEGADDARLARERGEHGALHAAAGQGRVEQRIGQRALEQPRGRVAVDERVQGIGHVAIGEHHRLDGPALLDRRAQRLRALVGGQQDDLGEVAAEDVQRALQQPRDAGGDVRRAREQARDLMQELEALVLAPLGHVGAVGEHDGRGRDDEQHGRAGVGGHRRRAAQRQARVGDAHRRGHGQRAHELGQRDRLAREPDDRAHEQRAEDRVGQRGQHGGAPHAGVDDGVGGQQRVEDGGGERAAEPEERDVERDLDRRLAAVDDQHDDRPEQDAEQHRPRLGEDEAEDQRQLAEREDMDVAAELDVHHAQLGHREDAGQQPPRRARMRAEGVQVADVQEGQRERARPHRRDQAPDARMAARSQAASAPSRGVRLT